MEPIVELGTQTLVLPNVIDIQKAADLREEWLAIMVDAPPEIVIDGVGTLRVDTAGLQVLCALMRSITERGIRICWRQKSVAIEEAATLLGLHHVLHPEHTNSTPAEQSATGDI